MTNQPDFKNLLKDPITSYSWMIDGVTGYLSPREVNYLITNHTAAALEALDIDIYTLTYDELDQLEQGEAEAEAALNALMGERAHTFTSTAAEFTVGGHAITARHEGTTIYLTANGYEFRRIEYVTDPAEITIRITQRDLGFIEAYKLFN